MPQEKPITSVTSIRGLNTVRHSGGDEFWVTAFPLRRDEARRDDRRMAAEKAEKRFGNRFSL